MSKESKFSENIAFEMNKIRNRKIEHIKKKLSSGAYKINSASIAKALVGQEAQRS